MKPMSSTSLALVVTALASGAFPVTDASMYGRNLLAPRRYHYSRRPHDTSFDLVSDILSMPVYVNNLMRQHHAELSSRLESSSAPRYSVTEDPASGIVELSMELPGVLARDLSVTLEDDRVLRIHGTRKHRGAGGHATYETEFDQSFQLTDGLDQEQLEVTLSAGILRVQARKKEKTVRQIPILTKGTEEEVHVANERSAPAMDESPVIDVQAEAAVEEANGLTIKEEEV